MSSKLVSLLGEKVLSSDGELPTQQALEGLSSCVLYFSAQSCWGFNPVLAEAFKDYRNSGGRECQVIFVSGDKDANAFREYFADMPWLAIPFDGCEELRKGLNEKFEVQGIPCLVTLNADGEKLDLGTDPRSLVKNHKAEAFPMTPEHAKILVEKQEQARVEVLQDLGKGNILPTMLGAGNGSDGASFVDAMATYNHIAFLFSDGRENDAYQAFADVQKEVNEGGKTQRLGVIYVGCYKYNEGLYASLQEQFYGLLDPSQEVKDKLAKLIAKDVRVPHVVVLGKQEDGSLKVVLDDPGTQQIQEFKAEGYPWSESRIEELKAAQMARRAELKQKQANLQFLKGASGRDGLFARDGAEVKVDTLASKGDDAVIGIYFSAHWQGFTPDLAKCYKELKDAGKDFQVVFVSRDKDDDRFKMYMNDMPWVAVPFGESDLRKDLNAVFEVQRIPTLILLTPGGALITSNGSEAVKYGAKCFPWGKKALEKEVKDLETQTASGGPVLKRLRGTPGMALSHNLVDRTIEGIEFATIGSPDLLAKAGVIYYEIEVVNANDILQIGFAGTSFKSEDERSDQGVGDDAVSWGFDGTRRSAWFDRCTYSAIGWANGDVIGFAANIDEGKIAVSKNGAWEPAPLGVFFTNEAIKNGVFPCMTLGHGYTIRYNLDGSSHGPFKHAPPKSWTDSAGYPQ